MALRVLLADESSSIKRVMELALQDFAIEVKPVFLGPDVLALAKQFKPDIVFIDILLQKLSGYEVSLAIKNTPELAKVPCVIMWSGFMELDEEKYRNSKADRNLEKPFTSDQLRKVVRDLVPKTASQTLADFMHLPEIIESLKTEVPKGVQKKAPPVTLAKEPEPLFQFREETVLDGPTPELEVDETSKSTESWNMESFAPIENFSGPTVNENETWVQTNLSKFKVPEPKSDDEFLKEIATPPPKAKTAPPEPAPIQEKVEKSEKIFAEPKISETQLEIIIRKQAKEMLESVIWKVVPDMAERIIKEEITRLMQDKDGQIQFD